MNEKEFTKSLSIVRESIHRIDPYSLLESGCPDDEFDSEINSITNQLEGCESVKDIAHTISRVLNSAFSEWHKPEDFEEEAGIIYKALVENGIK